MSYFIEKELKALLTYEEFMSLLNDFGGQPGQQVIQTNTYYDNVPQDLKGAQSALRLRNFDHQSEWTLKIKRDAFTSLELTHTKNFAQIPAPSQLSLGEIDDPQILHQLETLLSPDHQVLRPFLSLKTERWHFSVDLGEIAMDITHFADFTDYEIEFETDDLQLGQAYFKNLLAHHQIPYRPADKKIARAFA